MRKRILIVRLSALGDVAILEPVLRLRASCNSNCDIILAAPGLLEPLFSGIDNFTFVPTKKASPKQLYTLLSQYKPDIVLDMHSVIRTIGLSWLFRLHGIPVYSIRKKTPQSCPSWKRYNDVFDRCGLNHSTSIEQFSTQYRQTHSHDSKVVGVAPFAQHQGKIWPKDSMLELLSLLNAKQCYQIKLFGSKDEAAELKSWAEGLKNVEVVAGRFAFAEELDQISHLDLMVSMDSSNMHFASCKGVPVVSIWGATHPKRGFYGWRQDPSWAVQADLPCRPCSKFGDKPCRFGDYRCMKSVTPQMVLSKIEEVLG